MKKIFVIILMTLTSCKTNKLENWIETESVYDPRTYMSKNEMCVGSYIPKEAVLLNEKLNESISISVSDEVSDDFIKQEVDYNLIFHIYDNLNIVYPEYINNKELSKRELEVLKVKYRYRKFKSFKIKNLTLKDYLISSETGFDIIQEAKDENGKWKPIEYSIQKIGTIVYMTHDIPSNSEIEFAMPRYKGEFETELRINVILGGYGILTSKPYKGSINLSQFEVSEEILDSKYSLFLEDFKK
ncbi:hypothetical protein [Aureivirga sp. CE67]|uniref:hypothetical protein n=1 Tax=Aureivirga sp. CE67 TaxID=1788983 RepID=UPI0018C93306|nr:hypothetical protein [Aureivirga sp. CE67]